MLCFNKLKYVCICLYTIITITIQYTYCCETPNTIEHTVEYIVYRIFRLTFSLTICT